MLFLDDAQGHASYLFKQNFNTEINTIVAVQNHNVLTTAKYQFLKPVNTPCYLVNGSCSVINDSEIGITLDIT